MAINGGPGASRALVTIDLNVRCGEDGQETFAHLDYDVCLSPARRDTGLQEGDPVTVVEPEDDIYGDGVVVRVDHDRRLVFVRVDWASLAGRD